MLRGRGLCTVAGLDWAQQSARAEAEHTTTAKGSSSIGPPPQKKKHARREDGTELD